MTTISLAQRLMRYLNEEDITRLPMSAREELREKINLGLDTFGQLLPDARRQRPVTFLVNGPQTITLTVADGQNTVASLSEPVAGGKGLIVAADPKLNRLLSGPALMLPYFGGSGSQSAQVYCDGFDLGERADQIIGVPTFTQAGGSSTAKLTLRSYFPDNAPMEYGEVREWWLETFGGSDAGGFSNLLRLWPIPTVRGYVTVTLAQFCAPVTLNDMHVTARTLPVQVIEEGYLVALCAEMLLDSTLLREKVDKNAMRDSANRARDAMVARANQNPSGQPNWVGTPQGF
jgi:hypothetical protein